MMPSSKRLASVLLPLLAVVVLLPGAPARAGEISFPDEAGDATGFQAESTPLPNSPELDILEVSFTSDATSLHAVIQLESLGTPSAATGATRAAGFIYEGNQYWFRFQAPQDPFNNIAAYGFIFRKGGTTIPCGRCSGKLDPKTNTVRFSAEYKSMTSGMKTEDPDITPLAPGSTITGLVAETYRSVVLLAPFADAANPASEVAFTL